MNAGLDDYLTLFAFAVVIAASVAISVAIHAGLGTHFADLTLLERIDASRKTIIASSLVVWTFALPKLALVALL